MEKKSAASHNGQLAITAANGPNIESVGDY